MDSDVSVTNQSSRTLEPTSTRSARRSVRRHVKERAEKNTWVSTWTGAQLVGARKEATSRGKRRDGKLRNVDERKERTYSG